METENTTVADGEEATDEDDTSEKLGASQTPFGVGDLIKFDGHRGKFHAKVVKVYQGLEEAIEKHPKSFMTILQSPRGKPDPNQYFYYCEVRNSTHDAKGVAHDCAELIRRADDR